jgi:mRNA-decapping enzyme subunit 2
MQDACDKQGPQPYIKSHPHTQESSSQSSSQGNCDPQTPSPQYSEPPAHPAPNGHVPPVIADPTVALDTQALDPHFARLLSSLGQSASAIRGNGKEVLGLSSKELSALPTSHTPVPTTTSSAHSHPTSDLSDWSSSVPTQLPTRITETNTTPLHPGPMVKNNSPAFPYLQVSKQPHILSPHAQPNGIDGGPGSQALSFTASSSTSNPAGLSEASTNTWGSSSRRTASTADISPYLSRPPEIPTSGKRLKQLALLESVADESTRMTPMLARREIPLPQHNNRYPTTSAPLSEPPPPTNSMNDLRVIYSSGPGVQGVPSPVSPHSFNPQLHSRLPLPPNDPFQVRSRIGQACRGPPMLHAPMGRQVNIPETQTINSSHYPSGTTGVYPSLHHMQEYRLPFPPAPQQDHPFPPLTQSRVQFSQAPMPPPHLLPFSHSASTPLSAPAAPSSFDLPTSRNPSKTSSSLLSILNDGRHSETNLLGDR